MHSTSLNNRTIFSSYKKKNAVNEDITGFLAY